MSDFQKLQDIFEKVIEVPVSEQEALIRECCGGDAELEAEVRALLSVSTGRAERAETPLFQENQLVGNRLGPYKVIRELGRGGMGRVFLGEQEKPIRRLVAIKFVAFWGSDDSATQRFLTEQKNLARMSHPNIARLYESAVYENERPYFVMEFLDGSNIVRYCDEKRLNLSRRLELFADVCQGVAHAHLKGIIHRDMKPGNVMVVEEQGEAVPKVIDFGIAQAIDETRLTRTGTSPGSYSYMSPEQAGHVDETGKVVDQDFRTDVYSLGALLYELLIGRPPLAWPMGSSPPRILADICEKEPVLPSKAWSTMAEEEQRQLAEVRATPGFKIAKELKGDLDWIVMRALEKDPRRRYHSVHDMIRDIQNLKEDRPLEAGPPTITYLAAKFVKRHRRSVAFLSIFLLTILTLLAVVFKQNKMIRREKEVADYEAATAFGVSRFLIDILNTADPVRATQAEKADEVMVRDVIARARETMDESLADQLGTRIYLHSVLSEIYRNWGQFEAGLELAEEGLALQKQQSRPPAELTVSLLHNKGWNLSKLGRYDEAIPVLEEGLHLQRNLENGDALRTANILKALAELHIETRNSEAALPCVQEVARLAESEVGIDEELKGWSYYSSARILRLLRRYEEAVPYMLKAVELTSKEGEFNPNQAAAFHGMGMIYLLNRQFEEGEEYLQRAFALDMHFNGPDHPHVSGDHYDLARLYQDMNEAELASIHFDEALEKVARTHGEGHPLMGQIHTSIGYFLLENQPGLALSHFQKAHQIAFERLGEDDPQTARAQLRTAQAMYQLDLIGEAEPLIDQAVAVLQESDPEKFFPTALWVKGQILVGLNCREEAETYLNQALTESKKPNGRPGLDQKIQATIASLH